MIVLLKEILTNITATAGQSNGNTQNGHKPGCARPIISSSMLVFRFTDGNRTVPNGSSGSQTSAYSGSEPAINMDELASLRYREIKSKAISGALLLMVKWFKRSRMFTIHPPRQG